jgi:hypothetical protein
MPYSTTPPSPRSSSLKLAALTAVVLLAHGGLLYGTPLTMAVHSFDTPTAFSTRMIAPPATPLPQSPLPAAVPVRKLLSGEAHRPSATPPTLAEAAAPQTEPTEAGPGDTEQVPAQTAPAAPEPAYARIGQLLAGDTPPANLVASPSAMQEGIKNTPLQAAAPGGAGGPSAKLVSNFVFPPPLRLKYRVTGDIKGFPYYLKGDLQWQQDGKGYDARLEISHFLLGSRVQTSRGDLGPRGLEPIRFGDKVRSEVAAHFERTNGKVIFSANTPEAPLLPGAQDHLSAFMQLASMLAGAPSSFPEGTTIAFDAVGPRTVESWVFKVGALEKLNLPGGMINTIRLSRDAVGDYGTRGDIWLAPSLGYLPVRIRVTEPNNDVMDMKWSETVAP